MINQCLNKQIAQDLRSRMVKEYSMRSDVRVPVLALKAVSSIKRLNDVYDLVTCFGSVSASECIMVG